MNVTRDALAELAAERDDARLDDCPRCGTDVVTRCRCWTTADLYVVAPDGTCQPDPES